MRRGAWHQLGWMHHLSVKDQLEVQAGVGVVLSPRDLSFANSQKAVGDYKDLGASVLLDPQWYIPEFVNRQLEDYPTCKLRASVNSLRGYAQDELSQIKSSLKQENAALNTDAVIAPAVLYEASRPDIIHLNSQLHAAARDAAQELGVPCYGTAFLGESITGNMGVIDTVLTSIKGLHTDGWYFGFEFPAERIPSNSDAVYRCLRAALLLRLTGKPVMHAYAGPMGILSFGAGCDAAASGADQKQWRFCPKRWQPPPTKRGGGTSAPRYFSPALWGTIIHPDETAQLTPDLLQEIVTESPFASLPLPSNWSEGNATKHLVYSVAKGIEHVSENADIQSCQNKADEILERAVDLHNRIRDEVEIELKDDTASYQSSWRSALYSLVNKHSEDFEYLNLLG